MCILTSKPPINTVTEKSVFPGLDYSSQLAMLRNMKLHFVQNADAIRSLMSIVAKNESSEFTGILFKKDYKGKIVRDTDADGRAMWVMKLLINLLRISDPKYVKGNSLLSNMHDRLIAAFKEDTFEFVVTVLQELMEQSPEMKQNKSNRQWIYSWYILIMEFIAAVFRKESAAEVIVATSAEERRLNEKTAQFLRDEEISSQEIPVIPVQQLKKSKFSELFEREKHILGTANAIQSSRHSRFGGALVVKGANQHEKLQASNYVGGKIIHGGNVQSAMFHEASKRPVFNRRRLEVPDELDPLRSTREVKRAVFAFASDFHKSCFNDFMTQIWTDIISHANIGTDLLDHLHVSHFLIVIRFILEYNRCKNQRDGKKNKDFVISSSVNALTVPIFGFVLSTTAFYLEKQMWRQLSFCVGALKEILLTLEILLRSDDNSFYSLASRLLSVALYDPNTSTDLFVKLFKQYEPFRNSKRYFAELVEFIHVFLRMLIYSKDFYSENYITKTRRRRKSQKRKRGEESSSSTSQGEQVAQDEQEIQQDEIDSAKTAVLKANEKQFNLTMFLEQFCKPKVLKKYYWFLSHFKINTMQMNHYIFAMLQRVSKECQKEPYLFQLSLFKTLYDILQDTTIATMAQKSSNVPFQLDDFDDEPLQDNYLSLYANEMLDFSKQLVRNYVVKANDDPMFFYYLPFWKSSSFVTLKRSQDKGEEVSFSSHKRRRQENNAEESEKPDDNKSDYGSVKEKSALSPTVSADETDEQEYVFDLTNDEKEEQKEDSGDDKENSP